MGVVGSLPISPSSLPLPNNSDIQNEQSLPLPNQSNNNEAMSVMPDVIINNHIKTCRHKKSYENMSHDHLCIKDHQLVVLTGRCSKHRRYDNKESIKRELRCEKNRPTTRILNTTHDNIREQLKKQVRKLELKQNNLLSQVEKLYSYKQELEIICQQASSNHEFIE